MLYALHCILTRAAVAIHTMNEQTRTTTNRQKTGFSFSFVSHTGPADVWCFLTNPEDGQPAETERHDIKQACAWTLVLACIELGSGTPTGQWLRALQLRNSSQDGRCFSRCFQNPRCERKAQVSRGLVCVCNSFNLQTHTHTNSLSHPGRPQAVGNWRG